MSDTPDDDSKQTDRFVLLVLLGYLGFIAMIILAGLADRVLTICGGSR